MTDQMRCPQCGYRLNRADLVRLSESESDRRRRQWAAADTEAQLREAQGDDDEP